jgi:rSAM/selenodomain-associated transferase 1
MCPPLDAGQAARCQAAFLADLLPRMKGIAGARLLLAASPDRDAPELVRAAERFGYEICWQGPGDLGVRMAAVFERAARERAAAVVIGADSPDLPREYVESAFEALERPAIVVGPSDDGGYYLLGARERVPEVFDLDVEWGSPHVLERTLVRASSLRVPVVLLPWWFDVDDFTGLGRLVVRMRAAHAAGRGDELHACRQFLAELTREGLAP